MVIVVISRDCRKILVPYRVWPASPTESLLVKRMDVRRTAKVGTTKSRLPARSAFARRRWLFIFPNFRSFWHFFWGES